MPVIFPAGFAGVSVLCLLAVLVLVAITIYLLRAIIINTYPPRPRPTNKVTNTLFTFRIPRKQANPTCNPLETRSLVLNGESMHHYAQ